MQKDLIIRGARAHNLKNINLTIPRDKFVVLTGISGSGKSSLAFDTIYAEGQRRYVESLSAYARQFLGQLDKPDVDSIEGLSPAISIDQKSTSKNPRSTVGTVTEIYDYLRLLYARIGIPHCPICGREISSQSVDRIVDSIMAFGEGARLTVLAPVVREKKGMHEKVLDRIRREGFLRVRVDGEMKNLEEDEIKLEKNFKHSIDIVVDRIVVREGQEGRIAESVELAVEHGNGLIGVIVQTKNAEKHSQENAEEQARGKTEEHLFSTMLSCPEHGISVGELEPRSFSFNSPFGACPKCNGLGYIPYVDPDLVVENPDLSIAQGALKNAYAMIEFPGIVKAMVAQLCRDHGSSVDVPYKDLPEKLKKEIWNGTGGRKIKYDYKRWDGSISHRSNNLSGLARNIENRLGYTKTESIRQRIESFMTVDICEECEGKRLKPEILAVTVGGINIIEYTEMSVRSALAFTEKLENILSERDMAIARMILKEIRERLSFLIEVGLDYLTLARASATLSGGESQRIRLATQIGSSLVGVMYILDEP
ncbi:MAG: excinuclease ABC subunit UvrA, partial [Clostridiales bacterium]|nr:excinuclease ABC subunit UvrA [Clostridiales bacterium]